MSVLCSMVGASFTVAAAAEVLRSKKAITAVGNAQISTAQSKFGSASALFDGTSDYLSIANSGFNVGTGDITIEYWVRHSAINDQQVYSDFRVSGNHYIIYLTSGNKIEVYDGSSSYTGTTSLAANTWYHIALSRSGTSLKVFLNGAQEISGTNSRNLSDNGVSVIGCSSDFTAANSMNGHMDEIRVSNSARYTTTFTPSTTAFVNDANTLLLIHANGTNASTFFEDDNGVRASRSLIAIGNAQIDTAQSKFGGAALLCDGTGDYVNSPAGSHFDFGTGDFTIEYWIRFNAINTLYVPIALRSTASIGLGEWWCEVQSGDNRMYWGFKNQAGTTFYANFPVVGTAMTTGTFHHIALVKSGSTLTQYLNGTANGNVGTGLSGSFGTSGTDLWVGAGAGAYSLNGWMDEVRISNTARYTTTFTPSTTPFVNDANTLLLIHANGTDASTVFRDDNGSRASKGITAIGNAQVDTAQSKFGGASALFDGTGDYLIVQSNPLPTSGDFTVEFWFRITSLGTLRPIWSNRDTGGTNRGVLYINATGGITWWNAAINLNFATNISANTWYHIACVKDGSTRRLFIDGAGMVTDSGGYTAGDLFQIGRADYTGTAFSSDLIGYIDEFRVSNTARYTTTFTPSTTPFQSDANTLLLLHMDGTDASTVFTDDNGIAPYTP